MTNVRKKRLLTAEWRSDVKNLFRVDENPFCVGPFGDGCSTCPPNTVP